jgi:hypothetical protein
MPKQLIRLRKTEMSKQDSSDGKVATVDSVSLGNPYAILNQEVNKPGDMLFHFADGSEVVFKPNGELRLGSDEDPSIVIDLHSGKVDVRKADKLDEASIQFWKMIEVALENCWQVGTPKPDIKAGAYDG